MDHTSESKPERTQADDEIHLRDVWNLLIRNWLVIVAALVVTVGATVAYTLYTVPVYEASTSIRIEENRTDLPVLDILQTLSSGSEVETEMEVVRSRSLAEDVVDSLALQVAVTSPRGIARVALLDAVFVERWAPGGSYALHRQADASFVITNVEDGSPMGSVSTSQPATLPGATFRLQEGARDYEEILVEIRTFETAVESLQKNVTVSRPNREASIVTVRYESTDTLLVHRVPNALAHRFIARGRQDRKTEARSTVAFLQVQIDTLSRQLQEAEEVLTGFREVEQVVSIQAEAQAQVTNLSNLQATRNTIEAERSALSELVASITREAQAADPSAPSPYTRLISFPTLWGNQAASELLRNLNEVNALRSKLLERRTTQDPEVINYTERIHAIEEQLRGVATTYLQGLTNQVRAYDRTLAQFATELERIPAKEVQLARFERQQQVLEEVYTVLQNRLQEARVLEAVEDATVRVVDPAILPSKPVRPRTLLNLLLGMVLGGMLGVGVAFLREYLDETVHTREDVQNAAGGTPVLGMIPRIREMGINRQKPGASPGMPGEWSVRLVAGRDPRNPVSEAYRSLRTNLTFANPDHPPRTIVITSALPKDGKSTTAANLAITLAQQGIKALLVDADLRRGVLHSVFGVPREPGLTTVLTGQTAISEVIQSVDLGTSGALDFMASGAYPPNPAELLGSQRMKALLESLEARYDLVILDTAPLTVVTDAAVLGTKADGVILVARANSTEKGALRYSVEQLRNVRAPILGSVLNDVDHRRDSRYYSSYGKYGYYYAYYYADEEKKRKKRTSGKGKKS
ncbi:MAG TPA: polysaccharide biosynthesis tyrosine autokinase [Longimicrobiales bacterium]|nr:polysaccharide biosynthesis tyrosine autokinase [Longimicrobiales bacterium]